MLSRTIQWKAPWISLRGAIFCAVAPNKALQPTAQPLHGFTAAERYRYVAN
jgi:hypothetical protein